MQVNFTISRCTIVRVKEHRNGFSILVRERRRNHLSKPTYTWLGIWDKKAEAIKSKLKVGADFRFTGDVTTVVKGGKTYQNNTIRIWKDLPPLEKKPETSKPEPDDDWFVPEIRNHNRRSDRFGEGFTK